MSCHVDRTNDMGKVAKLSAEIRALRDELQSLTPTPLIDDPPPVPDTVDNTDAPTTVPSPDDTDALDPSPFTGAPDPRGLREGQVQVQQSIYLTQLHLAHFEPYLAKNGLRF